jgi:ribosome-associated toxin RatA of RatAB toxin-antitoxin module
MAEQTESTLTIAAAPSAVMAVISDIEAYPAWNGEVKSIEVLTRHADGRPDTVRWVLDAGAIKDTYTLAYAWQGDERVSWHLVEGQMLTAMDGSYTLTPRGDGSTEVTYRLAVDVKVPMIGMIKRKAEKVVIDRALKGLKKRVEG